MKNNKKSAIPVEAFYILSYLILMSLAGTTLYFYIESQSTAPSYRTSAASLIEQSESLKSLVDQERLFVLETVMFFLGSQGGITNIAEYNAYNLSLVPISSSTYQCIQELKTINNGIYPSKEILSKCITNSNYYDNSESLGLWKCDDYIYSYASCQIDEDNVNADSILNVCCDSTSTSTGYTCQDSCLNALGYDLTKCSDKSYCGALWCKENNLEIPETYEGVQYYYKIGEQNPGYYCDSILSYNPEIDFSEGELWTGLDVNLIIQNMIELSNNYFYKPNPNFNTYLSKIYNNELEITFQLVYKGCNQNTCEFSWVPYGDSNQNFVIKGLGGIPMLELSTDLLSLQQVEIPITDMIQYSKELIENEEIKDYFANELTNQVLIESNEIENLNLLFEPKYWDILLGNTLGINEYNTTRGDSINNLDFYDDSKCGEYPFSNTDYECLMQHVSTKLYSSISEPMENERSSGMSFLLRPVFNFLSTSLGGRVEINSCGNGVCEVGETSLACSQDCTYEEIIDNNILCNYDVNPFGTLGYSTICDNLEDEGYITNAQECKTNYIGSQSFSSVTDEPCTSTEYFENPSVTYNEEGLVYNTETCTYLLLSRDCNKDSCGNGVCEFSEDYDSCPSDCSNLHLYCGDGVLSNGETCPSDQGQSYSQQLTLASGKYSVFIKGQGDVSFTISIAGQSYDFEYSSDGDFYEQVKKYDMQTGRCAYNEYVPLQTDDYYSEFGCCSLENYNEGKCNTTLATNNYCTQINNKYGRSQIGSYCLMDNSNGGQIDYDINQFTLNNPSITISNIKGQIYYIDFIRVDFDSTYGITTKTANGITRTVGGSYEYYANTEDCSSATGETVVSAESMNQNEAWYSMLCLRSKGKDWIDIIENYTAIYKVFDSKFSHTSGMGKIDSFISKYGIDKTTINGVTTIVYTLGGAVQLSSVDEWETIIITQKLDTLATNDLIVERLKEIQQSTSYISLPIKWVFAYKDKLSVDSTYGAVGESGTCDLEYDSNYQSSPDCGCKSDCLAESVCNFDFSNIPINNLRDELQDFEAIFVTNTNYKSEQVVYE